ncbi:Fizzy-related protein-like, partial [Exaiptasia diaphana]
HSVNMDPEYEKRLLRSPGVSPVASNFVQENSDPGSKNITRESTGDTKEGVAYQCLLKNELLGAGIEDLKDYQTEDRKVLSSNSNYVHNVLQYQVRRSQKEEAQSSAAYSLSPIGKKSQRLLRSPRKSTRKISKIPFKVLDAPDLQDDFYLNLVDWSAQNILSVGLGTCVYLWSACTSQVTKLCDLSGDGDSVTSVSWSDR